MYAHTPYIYEVYDNNTLREKDPLFNITNYLGKEREELNGKVFHKSLNSLSHSKALNSIHLNLLFQGRDEEHKHLLTLLCDLSGLGKKAGI